MNRKKRLLSMMTVMTFATFAFVGCSNPAGGESGKSGDDTTGYGELCIEDKEYEERRSAKSLCHGPTRHIDMTVWNEPSM